MTTSTDGIAIALGYWTSSLSDDQATSITQSFRKAVSSVIRHPQSTIGSLDLLTENDREKILTWNGTLPSEVYKCVHEVVYEQQLKQPERPAVCGWDANFSYRELEDASSRLASHLSILGVGPEVMVPLCFARSSWTIVAMLGVLKSGGTFVPLDPSFPDLALQSRIQEIGAKVIVASESSCHRFLGIVDKVVVVSDASMEALTRVSPSFTSTVTPSDSAYVMFTSGSTGKPKGVVLEHSSVSTSITYHGPAMGFDEKSRTFQFSSYTFDACIIEILTTLFHGGCVCVPSESERMGDIAGAMKRMSVNIAFLTPAVARLIEPKDVPGLKTLSVGGEQVGEDIVKCWIGDVDFNDVYGPTECCMICSVGQTRGLKRMKNNIGRSVGSLSWIVDPEDHERLLPVGCVGELLVQGSLLARGYLNDAEKTARAFITGAPWLPTGRDEKRQRLYRTGDLVRYGPDGAVIYVGRKDTQVKIRGQRIELGEIEHCLALEEAVDQSIVIVPKKGYCKEQLVAILTLKELSSKTRSATDLQIINDVHRRAMDGRLSMLRDNLETRLPQYMVPNAWALLQSVPLTTSGKIDRVKAAKWIEGVDEELYDKIMYHDEQQPSQRQLTEIEKSLQLVWARVLNVPVARIGLDRSFFSLGGDSITAMQIVSACRSENLQVSVQDILQSRTISQLALRATTNGVLVAFEDEDFDIPFGLSPIQQLYFGQIAPQGSAAAHHFNQSFFARLTRRVDPECVFRALQAIVAQHSMLRANFIQDGLGQWSQFIPEYKDSFRFELHEVADHGQIASLAQASQACLDIMNGPVFAADMFNARNEQYLYVVAHHLVIDLVSWRIILQDLEEHLRTGSLSLGKPFPFQAWCALRAEHAVEQNGPHVPPISISPGDWLYWGMEGTENIHSDRAEDCFNLDWANTSLLLGEANTKFRTEPSEIILSALVHSFKHVFDNRSTPTFFIERHGRECGDDRIDLSRTVGWFTTITPLDIPVDSLGDILETLKRTKDLCRKISRKGWSAFAAGFLNAKESEIASDYSQMEVVFNYTGRQQQFETDDALLRLDDLGDTVSDIGGHMKRLALIEIDVTVINGTMKMSFAYNRLMHHQTSIKHWINTSKVELEGMLELLRDKSVEHTLSDFPLLPMTYDSLTALKEDRLRTLALPSLDDIEDAYPCSPMQQGILLSQIKSPGSYEVQQVTRINSPKALPVDVERFKRAWQQVVNRHPSLRTVFIKALSSERVFDQVVLKRCDAAILHIESHDANEAIHTLRAQASIRYGGTQPPHRLTICEVLTTGEVFYKVEISHALIDGMSIALLTRDIAQAYEGALPSSSGPLYSSYISYLQKQPTDSAIAYWTGYLGGTPPSLIPTLPATRDQGIDYQSVDISLDTTTLYEFCDEIGITVGTLLKVAWALVLRCFTNSDQVCFGYLASGRDISVDDVSNTVGVFITMLICRLNITPTTSVVELLQEVQEDYLQSLPFQHCSLAEIQHNLDLSGESLFNTAISLQRYDLETDTSLGISFEKVYDKDPTEVCHQRACQVPEYANSSGSMMSSLTLVSGIGI